MKFHIFTSVFFTFYRLYNYHELTKWPAPGWLDGSVGTVLVSQRSWVQIPFRPEFFQALILKLFIKVVSITALIGHILIHEIVGSVNIVYNDVKYI